MQTTERRATAFDNVAHLSETREQLHALRFAYVKLHRATLEVERLLREQDKYSPEREHTLGGLRDDCMFQRELCWKEIQQLDDTIAREIQRLNNGVYDDAA